MDLSRDPKTALHYLVDRIKAFPADIATRNAAPFMHRYLYRDHTPPCILSCFITSMLYANRTAANASIVMKGFQKSLLQFLEVEGGRVFATPTEKLAKVQALLLYQLIRLFDGDIALRVQGERDMPLLQAWLGDFRRERENLGHLSRLGDVAEREQPPKEWEVSYCDGCVVLKIRLLMSVVTNRDGSLPSLYEGPLS